MPFFERAFEEISDCLLAEEIEKGANKGNWLLQAVCEEEPDIVLFEACLAVAAAGADISVPFYTVNKQENKDWLTENRKLFNPVKAGRYYIYGSHITTPPPESLISLRIDAATAFGSGKHQTTKGCLLALDMLAKLHNFKPKQVLDMGCGTGILGMAAAKTFKCPVLAVDIDKESIRVTHKTAKDNGLSRFITAQVGNGYLTGLAAQERKYDLIFANILAKPLTLMANDLSRHLSNNGFAILSGLLTEQEQWVLSSHQAAGLSLKKRFRINEWSTLIVSKT